MTTPITFTGRLTADPELRFTSGGHAVAKFTVAVNERKKEGDQWVDAGASFYQCSVWRQYAENVTESLAKGDLVLVSGGLKQREYETTQGEKRSVWEVEVEEVGPSLRFATARPVKTGIASAAKPKPQPQGTGWGGQPAADPWATSDTEPPF
jgi:single-strand DNA-binding protein